MRWVDNNICVQEDDGEKDYPLGWYFRTEDEHLEGPFGTIEETKENVDKYVKWLNGEGKYEIFRDSSYYDMWCVRSKDDRRFNSPMSFHFAMKKDADEFKRLIEMAK